MTTSEIIRSCSTVRPYVTITSLVATLAAGVVGCAPSLDRADQASSVGSEHPASIEVPVASTKGRFDASFYEAQVREIGAPLTWAQTAGSTVTAIESQRALAEATRVRAAADHAAALAEANRLLAGAMSSFETQSAATRRIRANAEHGYTAAERTLAAEEAAFQAEHQASLQAAQAQLKAAQERAEALREQATSRYAEAMAEHERMLADADAYVDRTQATIAQIRESAGAALARAEAEANALRVRAQTRHEAALAHWNTVDDQVDSTREWAETRYEALMREATAVREQSMAEVERLHAQASEILGFDLDERYTAAVTTAESAFAEAQSKVDAMRDSTTTELLAYAADYTTDRKNARARLERDEMTYEAELIRIESDQRVAAAQASINAARAQELVHDAQARFVSEIANAMGGTTYAERSQAFGEAQQWAQSIAAGDAATASPTSIDTSDPALAESMHAFVSQLAQAKSLQEQAAAERERSIADAQSRRSQIEVWWNESRAATEAAIEGITHAEMCTIETMRQRLADAEELDSKAAMVLEEAQREADAARTVADSKRTGLLREAEHIELTAVERAEALVAQAQSAKAEGEEAIARLMSTGEASLAEAQAAAKALEAQAAQLLAEATAESASLIAMADASAALIEPEYQLRQAEAERVRTVAETEHAESLQAAQSLAMVAHATSEETLADLSVEVEQFNTAMTAKYQHASSARDAGLAEAERVLAEATTGYASFQADDAARRAEAEAVEQALLAFAEERHAVADAQDAAVFADFSSKLAVLQADRERSFADAYFRAFLAKANMTPEDMRRYVAAADAALGRLRSASTSNTTQPNQFEASASVAVEEDAGGVELLRVDSMSANGIATVPTDGDQ